MPFRQQTDKVAQPGQAPAPYRSQAPAPPRRSWMDNVTGAMANFNRGTGIGDELAAATDTAVNVLSGKVPIHGPGDIATAFGQSMQRQRGVEDDFNNRHPLVAAGARGTGMAATVVVPGGGQARAVALAPRSLNMLRGAVAAGTYGAAYAAADRGSAVDRLKAASDAARNPVVLGLGAAGGAVIPALRRPSPIVGRIQPHAETLRNAGVRLTPGQARGGVAKVMEDQATSLPILGPAIQGARQRGLQDFGRAVGNRALNPIGETVPEGLVGQDMVGHVKKTLGDRYDSLIPNASVAVDQHVADAMRSYAPDISLLSDGSKAQLQQILEGRLGAKSPNGLTLDGQAFQMAQSGLKKDQRRFSASSDPDHQTIADVLKGVSSALDDAASRQDPAFGDAIGDVNRGYAEYVRLRDASGRAANNEGVFMPSQYMSAVRSADASVGRGQTATGDALGQDLATAGQAVLPSKVGDSGTAGRNMVGMLAAAPGAAGGAMIAGAPGAALGSIAAPAATLTTLNAASRAYTPQAIEAFNAAIDQNSPQAVAALNALRQSALNDPRSAELYQEAVRRLAQGAGATAGTPSSGGARQ